MQKFNTSAHALIDAARTEGSHNEPYHDGKLELELVDSNLALAVT